MNNNSNSKENVEERVNVVVEFDGLNIGLFL
jgi:hypothetical protein